MVTAAALSVLAHVATMPDPVTIAGLVETTGYSTRQIHRALAALRSTAEVTHRRGVHNRTELTPGPGRLMTAYQRLRSDAGHVDWSALLTPSLLRVAWFLEDPTRISAIAARLHVTPQAVYRAVDPLGGRAMFDPDGPSYALAASIDSLHAVAEAAAWHTHTARTRTHTKRIVIEWYDPIHCLARPQTPAGTDALADAEGWHVTGLRGLAEYGLAFGLHREPLFWYSEDGPPTPAQLACHTILTDPGPRHVSYAMLLIDRLEIDPQQLRDQAAVFDIEAIIEAVIDALTADDWHHDEPLPSRDEYERLTNQYAASTG